MATQSYAKKSMARLLKAREADTQSVEAMERLQQALWPSDRAICAITSGDLRIALKLARKAVERG